MVASPDRLLVSYEEYLAWESTQEMRHEFCDGEVIAMADSSRNHNHVSLNFSKILELTQVRDNLKQALREGLLRKPSLKA